MGLYIVQRIGINRTANEDDRHEPNRESPPQSSPTGKTGSVAYCNSRPWPYRDIARDPCRHLLGGGVIMNDYQLDRIARCYAEDIASELKKYGGDAIDLAHQYTDGSEHVIYYHKAHAICQNCDISNGEDFVEDCGDPEGGWSYDGFAVAMAYGELYSRIVKQLYELEVVE